MSRSNGGKMLASALAVILGAIAPAVGQDFTDDFSSGDLSQWVELDFVAIATGGASNPFTLSVDQMCDPLNWGLLGSWSNFDPGAGNDDFAVAMRAPEVFTDVTMRMKIRWSCNPAISCDPFEGVCRLNSEESNVFMVLRNRVLLGGSFNCYVVELHDSGILGIIKATQTSPTNIETPRIKETRVSLDLSRDAWMRAEIQTIGDAVRIRARVWQNDSETPGDGTEDEPCVWDIVGDDTSGRDAWEDADEVPDPFIGPFPGPGSVGVGWNEDDGGGSISDMTLDDVSASSTPKGPGIAGGDLDCDGDVDLADFGLFQACFNGPNRPAACR